MRPGISRASAYQQIGISAHLFIFALHPVPAKGRDGLFFMMKHSNLLLPLLLLPLFLFSSCGNSGDKPAADTTHKADSLYNINAMIRKDPGNLDLYVRRARISMAQKDYASAMNDMNRVLAVDSSKAEYLLAAADVNFFTMHTARTKQLLERAVEVNPENVDCLLQLAQLYHYFGKSDDEKEMLDRALKVDPRNAKAFFMKGMMYKDMGDTARAISSMQSAVEKEPDYYNAYIQLGVLCAAQHNPLAESYYLNAININPGSEEAIYNLGMFYQGEHNWNRAIETYTTLLKLNPKNFDAHFNLGYIHSQELGAVDEGMKYFELCIDDNPKEPRGYYGVGWCFEKKGDIANAKVYYKKALEADPNYTNASLKLEKLER